MNIRYGFMSDEELREEAMKKTKCGNYRKTAICAQYELWNRNHWFMENDLHYEDIIKESHEDLLIEDIQYEGNE